MRQALAASSPRLHCGFRRAGSIAALVLIVAAAPVLAADPAAQIGTFDNALIDAMKAGKAQPLTARVAKLQPVVRVTHDMAAMAALVVGQAWTATPAADRTALIEAFARHSSIAYAENFASFGGEKFMLDPKVETRGSDRLVRTTIVAPGSRTALNYRMRQGSGGWKIVDIYADGISQVATQRAEFAATIKASGVGGLAKRLNALDDAKLKRR